MSILPRSADSAAAASQEPEQISTGERMFDWMTYGGFAGAATFALGLPVGYWARYSPSGKQTIHFTAHALEKMGLSAHSAEDAVMTTALMQGGNAMLFAVKAVEDKKPQIVAAFNRCLGENADPLAVEKEPKQTWTSLIPSRLIAWGAVFGALRGTAHFAGKDRFDQFEKSFAKNMLCKPLGQPTHINGVETRLFRLGRIGAIDSFATASAAVLLYAGSRMFADKKQDITLSQEHQAPDPSVALSAMPETSIRPSEPALSYR